MGDDPKDDKTNQGAEADDRHETGDGTMADDAGATTGNDESDDE